MKKSKSEERRQSNNVCERVDGLERVVGCREKVRLAVLLRSHRRGAPLLPVT